MSNHVIFSNLEKTLNTHSKTYLRRNLKKHYKTNRYFLIRVSITNLLIFFYYFGVCFNHFYNCVINQYYRFCPYLLLCCFCFICLFSLINLKYINKYHYVFKNSIYLYYMYLICITY